MATPVKVCAKVIKVLKHASTVVSYQLEPLGRVPKFHPGQFLHLTLSDYSTDRCWPESRVFSIASSPTDRKTRLDITISVKGMYTKRIYEELAEGDTCWLKLPYGEFFFPTEEDLVLIAGGVGITPFIAKLERMLEVKSDQHVFLYYGIRSKEVYLFADLIRRCGDNLPNFQGFISCEDGSVPGDKGVLDIDKIARTATTDSLYYLSGPPPMIQVFKRRLIEKGIQSKRIRVDNWE